MVVELWWLMSMLLMTCSPLHF